ncbi:MAG: nucleoside diphosphate kinase regulator [Halioglobus sp.]|nr:nucleoside diphosphate kinase regulator [Halioglobus sp.]
MLPLRSVLIGQRDRDRIYALLCNADTKEGGHLFDEIDAATVVPDHMLPADVVTMHSTVSFVDLDTTGVSTVTLVYPHELAQFPNSVSILAPVGAALIGLQVGEVIEWPLPNGRSRKLQVVAVEAP